MDCASRQHSARFCAWNSTVKAGFTIRDYCMAAFCNLAVQSSESVSAALVDVGFAVRLLPLCGAPAPTTTAGRGWDLDV